MKRWTIIIAGVLLGLGAAGIRTHWRLRAPAPDRGASPPPAERADPEGTPSGRAPEGGFAPQVGDLRVQVRAGGRTADGAEVTVVRESTQEKNFFTLPAGGVQTVLKMPAGHYRVGVCYSRFVFACARIEVEAGKTAEVTLDLFEGTTLHGKVMDPSGRPLEGARVRVDPSLHGEGLSHDLATITTASGEYCLDGIPPGTFNVKVRREGYRGWERSDLYLPGAGCSMELQATLLRGKGLAGRVLTESGAPVAGAVIMASNEDVATAHSDSEGRFGLRGLGDAAAWASASAEGYGVVTIYDITPDSTEVEFRLPRAASIRGEVDAAPKPDRFTVRLLRRSASPIAEGPDYERRIADVSGRFFLPGITPGRYRVQVEAGGYEVLDAPEIELASGQSLSDLTIRLQRKAAKNPP